MSEDFNTGDKKVDDPSTTSFAYDEMAPRWDMMDTLLGGTRAMREAGPTYLPKHEAESDVNYQNRLNVNTLFNMTELTLESLVGRPFSDPVRLNDDVPKEIARLSNDVDLQGNNLSTFCRAWMRDGVAKAFSHVVVDFPRITQDDERERTLADDREEGARPYWLHVRPENLIFASATVGEDGREVLDHVRILKTFTERVGFAEVIMVEILVLEPGTFTTFVPAKQKVAGRTKWEVDPNKSGFTGLDFIPLVTFYADRKGLMLGKPPLEDLAFLNVAHWQSTSDQRNILTVARFPMLAVSGAQEQSGTTMVIGPRKMLTTRDPQGKYYYVEHDGKAMQAGNDDLDELKTQMCAYGADFLKKNPNGQTATARALDSAEATSPLQDMTVRFIDAVNTALAITAVWMGLAEKPEEGAGGTVTISTDFGPEEVEEADLKTLVETRKSRDISRAAYLEELKRRGLLADDYDSVDDINQLRMEQNVMASFMNPDQGQQAVAEMRRPAESKDEGDDEEDDDDE